MATSAIASGRCVHIILGSLSLPYAINCDNHKEVKGPHFFFFFLIKRNLCPWFIMAHLHILSVRHVTTFYETIFFKISRETKFLCDWSRNFFVVSCRTVIKEALRVLDFSCNPLVWSYGLRVQIPVDEK